MLTNRDIQDAIENCEWRRNFGDTWICDGDIVPCIKHINDGRCDTLMKLFTKERSDNEID